MSTLREHPGPAPVSASLRKGSPSSWRLLLLHTRYQLLEQFRIPMAVVGNIAFPAISFLFFVVPQSVVRDDPVAASAAAGQLALVSVLSVCLFTFGLSGAEDRGTPWDPYLRTLSAGVLPRLGARLITGVAFALLGTVTIALIALVTTSARFTGLQMLFLPLAFAGGLFLPPHTFPGWLDSFSVLLPSRGGRDLVVAALTSQPVPARAVVCVAVWALLAAVFAAWAYRRDEGCRFR